MKPVFQLHITDLNGLHKTPTLKTLKFYLTLGTVFDLLLINNITLDTIMLLILNRFLLMSLLT